MAKMKIYKFIISVVFLCLCYTQHFKTSAKSVYCTSNLEIFTLPCSEMSQLNSTHYLKRQCQLNYYYCSKLWLLITMYSWFAQNKVLLCFLKKRKDCCSSTVQDPVLKGFCPGHSRWLFTSLPSFFDFGKELIGCIVLCGSWRKKWVTIVSF